MRELSINEVQQVNGGNPLEGFNWGAAIGTVGGAVLTGSSIGATRGGFIGGGNRIFSWFRLWDWYINVPICFWSIE